jgi:RHS repeat-associated protein
MALYNSDGSVIPMYFRQGSIPTAYYWDSTGVTNPSLTIDTAAVPASDPSNQSTVAYSLTDHLGTAQMTLSGGGWPVWKGEFSPFGQELDTQFNPDNFKFAGKERDAESRLDYFGARYYTSLMGRWMSSDWADKPEAVPYSSLDNPQSLNLYGYVNNNPLSHADPDGHECPTCDSVVNFVAGAFNAWGSDNLAGAGRVDQASHLFSPSVVALQMCVKTYQYRRLFVPGGRLLPRRSRILRLCSYL